MKRAVPAAALAILVGHAPAATLFTSAGALVNDTAVSLVSTPIWAKGAGDSGTLYFQFTVNPISDNTTENYFAAFQFFEGGSERLGLGNNWPAHAYSAFLTDPGNIDLNSANPEGGVNYQLVRSTDITTIVARVDFNAGASDSVTVWLDPDQTLLEGAQDPALATAFTANATFDELRLREGTNTSPAGADGWQFSNIVVGDSSSDVFGIAEPSSLLLAASAATGLFLRRRRQP